MANAPITARKCPLILLEVLIAFALTALCVLPLIYPHVHIFKTQKEKIASIELDHAVQLLFARCLEQLYRGEIAWADIENESQFPIDEASYLAAGYPKPLPFRGHYAFKEITHKPSEPQEKGIYLFELNFIFTPMHAPSTPHPAPPLNYHYRLVIERTLSRSDEVA